MARLRTVPLLAAFALLAVVSVQAIDIENIGNTLLGVVGKLDKSKCSE